jgi:hypothetical protein
MLRRALFAFILTTAAACWGSAAPLRSGALPGGAVWAKSTATPIDAEKANLNKVDSCLSNLTCQRPSWSARRAKRHRCRQHPALSSFPADPGDCPPLQRTETHLTWDVLAPFWSARSWFVG